MKTLNFLYSGVLIAALILPFTAPAQWIDYKAPGMPRTKDGKVNPLAPTPHAPNGKPDLTGVWLHEKSTQADYKKIFGPDYKPENQTTLIGMENEAVHKYGFNVLLDFKPDDVKLTPAGDAAMKARAAARRVDNVCHGEYGWPVASLLAEPFKIIQAPSETMFLYEVDNLHRQIFTDGRPFPKEFQLPAYLGYSVGRWDKDTFIVETRGFNDRTPLDAVGHPRSENMHVTETFHRRDFGHLETTMTFDDPETYVTKFTIKVNYTLVADNDIFEMFCGENEKDRVHMVSDK